MHTDLSKDFQAFGNCIKSRKKDILSIWSERVRADPAIPHADNLELPVLINHIPQFLDFLISYFESEKLRGANNIRKEISNEQSTVQHAVLRGIIGYELPEAIRELSLLRIAIIEACCEEGTKIEVTNLLHAAIDQAITEAAVAVSDRDMSNLNTAKCDAETASMEKNLLLANISHEIRTPLTALLGFCEMAMENNSSEEVRNRYLSTIKRNGEMIARLMEDLLDLAKIEAKKLSISTQEVSPFEILDQVVEMFSPQLQEKAISFRIDYEDSCPDTIVTDPVRLKQILINLISNALKFTEQGQVAVRVRCDEETFNLAVLDTGCGIPKEHQERLFQPFSRIVGKSEVCEGSGLGLVLARKIAEVMGGTVALAHSEPEKGYIFTASVRLG